MVFPSQLQIAESAQIYAVGGGYVSRVAVVEAEGVGLGGGISTEPVGGSYDFTLTSSEIDVFHPG